MRRISIATAVALALALPQLPARAQPSAPGPAEISPKLNLTLEQRHIIRENMKDMKAEAAAADLHPAVGDHAPEGVKLSPMPEAVARKVPQVKTHQFFLSGAEIVIVDPKANIVAEVIKLSSD